MSSKVQRKTTRQSTEANVARPETAAGRVRVGELRQVFGLNRKLFSRLTGYSERAIAKWESGQELSEASRQRMVELQRLQRDLARVMKADFIGEWLRAPNEAFEGLKPIEVVERGEVDRIWRMIYELESGAPG